MSISLLNLIGLIRPLTLEFIFHFKISLFFEAGKADNVSVELKDAVNSADGKANNSLFRVGDLLVSGGGKVNNSVVDSNVGKFLLGISDSYRAGNIASAGKLTVGGGKAGKALSTWSNIIGIFVGGTGSTGKGWGVIKKGNSSGAFNAGKVLSSIIMGIEGLVSIGAVTAKA